MQRFLFVFFAVIIGFFVESLIVDLMGRNFKPNILIIIVVFFNLAWGIRYSLLSAGLAGLLRDAMSVKTFGLNLFPFLLCAYLTTILAKYIYQRGSNASRFLLVIVVELIFLHVQYILNFTIVAVSFSEFFRYVLLPETIITAIVTIYVFQKLRRCALRFLE
ncbi:MAG: rod shape-determining protein MreD [Candidatus Omnitrophica bacterium]|nr:rod shape-determining protein MreD [Candidatus Omnitrophota bacterium]